MEIATDTDPFDLDDLVEPDPATWRTPPGVTAEAARAEVAGRKIIAAKSPTSWERWG